MQEVISVQEVNISSSEDITLIERDYPFESREKFESTYAAIRTTALNVPNDIAVSFFLRGQDFKTPQDITYKALLENITQTANFFHSLNLKSDDVVAFMLPNLPETHYVMWGAEAACQVFAINPLLEANQIKQLINSAGATVIVTMNPMSGIDLWPKIEQILPELKNIKHVVGVDIAQYVTGVAGLAAKIVQAVRRRAIKLPQGKSYYNFTHTIKKQKKKELVFHREFSSQTISSLFCTGGTTGLPKIARRTHQNELANAYSTTVAMGSALDRDGVILGGLPLFHVNGALATGLAPFLLGAKVVMATPQGYRGENVFPNFWSIIERYQVSTFSGVPTVYSALMDYPTEGKDLSSLEYCICGAAPMPVETFKAFERKTGVKILEGYGLTEGTCVSSINPVFGERKVGSIGMRVPYQEMMCSIIDGNKIVRKCDVDEIGVLVVKGPNIFLGYQLEHQNKDLWLVDDEGSVWLNTGDLAREDVDNYFWLTGRKKELIVRGGHNIEPKLIEEIMCEHAAVSLAAAVGKPDEHAGEVPVCYVQLSSNTEVTESELLEFAKKRIPERAAIPKSIHVVDALPVTAVGKVFKPELEMLEIKKCVSDVAITLKVEKSLLVNVVQDPLHGLLAQISLEGSSLEVKEEFSRVLGKFTFKSMIK